MSLNLDGFDDAVSDAVRTFWSTRESAIEAQLAKGIADRGGRAGVTSGKNMDGFVALVADMVRRNGLPDAQIFLSRGVTTLPGYFRPTKDWDLVVMHRGMLVAAQVVALFLGDFIVGIGLGFAGLVLIRPCEVLSRVANVTILEVANNALRVLLQHRHVIIGSLA